MRKIKVMQVPKGDPSRAEFFLARALAAQNRARDWSRLKAKPTFITIKRSKP